MSQRLEKSEAYRDFHVGAGVRVCENPRPRLLDWTQQELANAARIGVATVRLCEGNAAESRPLAVLRRGV